MTNPAPLGGDERPNADPLPVDEVPPPAMPPPPAYETAGPLDPTPAYDALAAEAPLSDPLTDPLPDPLTGPVTEPVGEPLGTGAASALGPEADYALAPNPTDAGALAQVKTLAAEKPAAFLGALLAAGWLLGKITSRGKRSKRDSDDED